MGRLKTEINPIRAERVKIMIEREGLTQKELGLMINRSQQSISEIVHCKRALTESTAQEFIRVFPEYRIEWLMGYDDIMLKAVAAGDKMHINFMDVYKKRFRMFDNHKDSMKRMKNPVKWNKEEEGYDWDKVDDYICIIINPLLSLMIFNGYQITLNKNDEICITGKGGKKIMFSRYNLMNLTTLIADYINHVIENKNLYKF